MEKIRIYVDGSYREKGLVGWAFVAVDANDNILAQKSGSKDGDIIKIRNIGGELKAAIEGISWAAGREAVILFDYQGIESWATGEWKAKNYFTRSYREFVAKHPNISFKKVEAHSGDRWNEYVDAMAKEKAL